MKRLSASRLWTATLLAATLSAAGAAIPENAAETELERAFGAAFALVPAVARVSGDTACRHHGRQASKIADMRDLQMSRDRALALLKVPEKPSPTEVDRSIDAAFTIIHRAVVDFVYSPSRPPADVAAAMVNSACLIEVGKVLGRARSSPV